VAKDVLCGYPIIKMSYTQMLARAGIVGVLVLGLAAPDAWARRRDKARELVGVEDVLATSDGHFVVLLKTKLAPARFLPIWIGETEAMQIRMHLDRRVPPRPLTLNLLESVLDSSRVKLIEIQIDAVKGGIFLGRLRLRQNGRSWNVDARPSDAVGLALGRGASIFVSRQVLNSAAINPAELAPPRHGKDGERRPHAPAQTSYEETL